MVKYIVVMSDHKHPKYYVARKMIGQNNYAVVCTARSQFDAERIASAMNGFDDEPKVEQRVITLKRKRA